MADYLRTNTDAQYATHKKKCPDILSIWLSGCHAFTQSYLAAISGSARARNVYNANALCVQNLIRRLCVQCECETINCCYVRKCTNTAQLDAISLAICKSAQTHSWPVSCSWVHFGFVIFWFDGNGEMSKFHERHIVCLSLWLFVCYCLQVWKCSKMQRACFVSIHQSVGRVGLAYCLRFCWFMSLVSCWWFCSRRCEKILVGLSMRTRSHRKSGSSVAVPSLPKNDINFSACKKKEVRADVYHGTNGGAVQLVW